MPKMSLLDMVQDILSDMDSDEVNSINDTIEAMQVAQIIKTTYYNIMDGKDWPHLKQFFQLEASDTTARPNYMKLPENVINVEIVKYNKKKSTDLFDKIEDVKYKTPEEFLDLINNRLSNASNILVVTDTTNITLNILKDSAPSYFTSFDDEWIIFDSYDNAIDNTLQASKTQCYGKIKSSFTISDSFIPDIPIQMFSYLLNEAKSTAFLILKQAPNQKAEQHSISQRRRMSQEAWRIKKGISYPNYGRKGK